MFKINGKINLIHLINNIINLNNKCRKNKINKKQFNYHKIFIKQEF